jgi:hypothetical protein
MACRLLIANKTLLIERQFNKIFNAIIKKPMADDVVDLRKRIEEMRNEVSAAIVANRGVGNAPQSAGHNSDTSLATDIIEPVTAASASQSRPEVLGTASPKPISSSLSDRHKSLETNLNMPAFQLNIRNQTTNKLLLVVIGIQLITNILLILMAWIKLG